MTDQRNFRAKPIDPKQAGPDGFVYGDLRHTIDSFTKEPVVHGIYDYIEGEYYPVHPHTVGQLWGKDKNDEDIYVGDYVCPLVGRTDAMRGKVIYDKVEGTYRLDVGTEEFLMVAPYDCQLIHDKAEESPQCLNPKRS